MQHRWLLSGATTIAIVSVLLIATVGTPTILAPTNQTYERTEVTIYEEDTLLTTVKVRIADTERLRYIGLSDTETLDADQGMLFVHDEPGRHRYVMRDMAFPIDIVFIDRNGTITAIHAAPVPDGPADTHYAGYGTYVLEVPYGYTNMTGVTVGDRVEIDGYPPGES